MRHYTLTIKNAEGKTVVELGYDYYSQVKEAANLLIAATNEHRPLVVQVYDNETKQIIVSEIIN